MPKINVQEDLKNQVIKLQLCTNKELFRAVDSCDSKEIAKLNYYDGQFDAAIGFRPFDDMTFLEYATLYSSPEVVKYMLVNGAQIDKKLQEGDTALHRAIENHKRENFDILLMYSANIENVDKRGNTPLHTASYSSIYFVERLLERGANLEAKNVAGETPYQVAQRARKNDNADIILNFDKKLKEAPRKIRELEEKCNILEKSNFELQKQMALLIDQVQTLQVQVNQKSISLESDGSNNKKKFGTMY